MMDDQQDQAAAQVAEWIKFVRKGGTDKEKAVLDELLRLRDVIENLDETARYFADRINTPVRLIRRDFVEEEGALLGFTCELKELVIGAESTKRPYNEPAIRETKVIRIPKSSMLYYEFVLDKMTLPSEEKEGGGGVLPPPKSPG